MFLSSSLERQTTVALGIDVDGGLTNRASAAEGETETSRNASERRRRRPRSIRSNKKRLFVSFQNGDRFNDDWIDVAR